MWTEEHEKRILADLAAAREFATEQGREPKTVVLSYADATAALDEIGRLRGCRGDSPIEPVPPRPLAERLRAARFERDRLDERIRSYDGGDRPMSPPAQLLRDYAPAPRARVPRFQARAATPGPVAP